MNLKTIFDKECVLISVEDTGIGIKKQNIENLFKMFSMIEDSK